MCEGRTASLTTSPSPPQTLPGPPQTLPRPSSLQQGPHTLYNPPQAKSNPPVCFSFGSTCSSYFIFLFCSFYSSAHRVISSHSEVGGVPLLGFIPLCWFPLPLPPCLSCRPHWEFLLTNPVICNLLLSHQKMEGILLFSPYLSKLWERS